MFKYWAILIAIVPACGQSICGIPLDPIKPRGATIFTPQQEGFAGEYFEEQMRSTTPVYRLDGATDGLERIASRLIRFLPPNEYSFKFALIELPAANAFVVPGGHVFVSRRLILSLESEDELAGILAHEMGHVLARQASVDLTRALRELGYTSLGDRADVYSKLNALLDRPVSGGGRHEDDDQIEADRISSAAMWRAGYDPAALPRWLDRMSGNKGATGNLLSDFFGATKPESKRYREMLKAIDRIPQECRLARATSDETVFQQWRQKVIEFAPEDLVRTSSNRQPIRILTPALRPDLKNIKFSFDGKLILAQDPSGITILQHEPLQVLFRIPALGASPALFLRDSESVSFISGGGRIETWSASTRARTNRVDLPLDRRCIETILSPDGQTFACLTDFGISVDLFEIGRDQPFASRHRTPDMTTALVAIFMDGKAGRGIFTPDGSSFLHVGGSGGPWAYSVSRRQPLSLGGPLKGTLGVYFAFLDAERIAVVASNPKDSGIFAFPGGKQLDKFVIPPYSIASATKGDTLFLRPMAEYAVGAMSISDRQIFLGSPKVAMDRFGDIGAGERNSGELALYSGRSTQAVATVQLPASDLAEIQAGVHSSDFGWLAISSPTRSGMWDLTADVFYQLLPFDEASIVSDQFLATFEQREPKPNEKSTKINHYRTTLDLESRTTAFRQKVEEGDGLKYLHRDRFVVRSMTTSKDKVVLEVSDLKGTLLWSRQFDDGPSIHVSGSLIIQHNGFGKEGSRIIKAAGRNRDKDRIDSILEVVEFETGRSLGSVVLTDNVMPTFGDVAGKILFIQDSNNRTLAYSLETGARTGQQFGHMLAVDAPRARVATTNQMNAVIVYDSAMRALATFEYPRNVVYAGFDGDGRKLIVVTGAQEVFIESLP